MDIAKALEQRENDMTTISVWMKQKDVEIQQLKTILWRIKSIRHMGEDAYGRIDGRGGRFPMKWNDALCKFPPTILEILFEQNPFGSLVSALKGTDTKFLQNFLSSLRYFHVGNSDAEISDILFLLSQMSSLVAFSYSNSRPIMDGVNFENLISTLSLAQIRAIDITGSCQPTEIDGILRNLNVELVRFCSSPGITAASFLNATAINPTVEFVVAQGINFSVVETDGLEEGMNFLKNLKDVFPSMKSLYWDWNMIDPCVTFDGRTRNCIKFLADLYRELNMEMLAIVFYAPGAPPQTEVESVWEYFKSFSLPNSSLIKHRSKGLGNSVECTPNFAFFLAGVSDKLQRLQTVICDDRITSPDLRHFLYILDPSINIHKANATFEFLGFDVELTDC